ncbi:MAG: hypothetical protein GEV11_27090 [Streptosporangiales bacterium]|nr:hypothetical protein [Streptosporangiales bacterium]
MKRLAAASAALLVLITACGPDLGSGLTACQLITKTDVQKAIPEVTFTESRTIGDKAASQCLFVEEGSRSFGMNVSIRIDRTGGDDKFESDRKRAESAPGHSVTPQPGLGEEAYIERPADKGSATVETRSGDAVLTVAVSGGFEMDRQALALTRLGLSRL